MMLTKVVSPNSTLSGSSLAEFKFPQPARALSVLKSAFVYSFEMEKSQTKLLRSYNLISNDTAGFGYNLHGSFLVMIKQRDHELLLTVAVEVTH